MPFEGSDFSKKVIIYVIQCLNKGNKIACSAFVGVLSLTFLQSLDLVSTKSQQEEKHFQFHKTDLDPRKYTHCETSKLKKGGKQGKVKGKVTRNFF